MRTRGGPSPASCLLIRHQRYGCLIRYVRDAGFLLALLYCFISGFAGVYLEYLMKRPTEQFNSFHFQNVQVPHSTLLCSLLPFRPTARPHSQFFCPHTHTHMASCTPTVSYSTRSRSTPTTTRRSTAWVRSHSPPPPTTPWRPGTGAHPNTRRKPVGGTGIMMLAGSDVLTAITGTCAHARAFVFTADDG